MKNYSKLLAFKHVIASVLVYVFKGDSIIIINLKRNILVRSFAKQFVKKRKPRNI